MQLRINADIVITGNGESYKNGAVVLKDGKIVYAGEIEHAPVADKELDAPVVLPGLWDTHVHFLGVRTLNLERIPMISPQVAALRSVWDMQEALHSGITTVRELGGHGLYLARVINEGMLKGPRIYSAGALLSTTGGHADIHSLPLDMLELGYHSKQIPLRLADGHGDCLKAVREQLREGAEVIKYCASGGVLSEIDHPIHQQFSLAEQKAIVEEAKRAEVSVAAHCHGAPGIKSALEAGVKSIEHGTWLDEDLADLMLEKDAILVPTRYIVDRLFTSAQGVPEYAMIKLRNLYDQHFEAMKLAIKKGVKIAMGTDMGLSGPGGFMRWGENAEELVYYVKAGMTPADAIVTATGNAPQVLGKRAPKSGLLKEGYDADLLLLKNNPLDDITEITKRDNIVNVVKSGKIMFKH